jgi:23S rRNA pseudouridine1911/1915/1917 synthase
MNASLKVGADYSANPCAYPPLDLVVPAHCAGLRLDQALARMLPEHSRSRLAGWVREGRVRLDGEATDPKRKVWGGERVLLAAAPELAEAAQQAEDIPLDIVHEDEAILVIDKPAGLVVHPGSGNWQGTLLNALLHHSAPLAQLPRAGIVHRLDKDTSGLLVVAKTLEAQTDLVRQLQARTVKRHYLALVHGRVAGAGIVDAPIGRHPLQRTKMAVVPGGRAARTRYSVLERFAAATLLECALETGRTHQIRVHMTQAGHPLVGDRTYGPRRSAAAPLAAFPRQALHAWRLALLHPLARTEIGWEAPPPDDFGRLLAGLRAGE